MSSNSSVNFTALLLITQSLQATSTAVAPISQPAIEMVHQAAEGKPATSTSEAGSRSSSKVRHCIRRVRTSMSLSTRMREDANASVESLSLEDNSSSANETGSDTDDSTQLELSSQNHVRGRASHRASSQFERRQSRAKLSKKIDPRDFMKEGIPDDWQQQQQHYHHHHYHYHQHHHQADATW